MEQIFTVNNGYLYVLIDTGNVGVLKFFKIKSGEHYHLSIEYRDDNIEWNIYFGNINEYYLGTKHLVYNVGNNVRLILMQKVDEEHCKIRIVDVSPNGEIISNKELGLVFGNDLMLAENPLMMGKNYGEILTGIYTVKNDGEKSYVTLIQFNTEGEMLQTYTIGDKAHSLIAKDVSVAENGEIGVVSIYHISDCYWGYCIHIFDSNFNLLNKSRDNAEQYADFTDGILHGQVKIWRGFRQDERVWKHLIQLYNQNSSNKYEFQEYTFNSFSKVCELSGKPPIPVSGSQRDKPRSFYYVFLSFFDSYPGMTYYFFRPVSRKNLWEICSETDSSYNGSANIYIKTPFKFNHFSVNQYIVKIFNAKIRSEDTVYYSAIADPYTDSDVSVKMIRVAMIFFKDFPTEIYYDKGGDPKNTFYAFSGDYAIVKINNSNFQNLTITLFDLVGNKIGENKLFINNGRVYIPISMLQNGIYFYHIKEINERGKFGVIR